MLWQFSRGGCPGVPSYAGYAVTCQIYWPAMIYNLILVGLVLVVLSMFLRKKRIVPALFISALVIAAVLNAIIAALTHPYFSSDLLYRLMVLLGNSLFLIPYLTRARRVKDTFVVELSPDSLWDRLFIPLDRPLERFYGWLTGIGRWIFLLSPGFAVVIMLFCGILWDMVNRSLG